MTPALLGWRPFLDPIDLHSAWYLLLVPLALGISVVYKAVRLKTVEPASHFLTEVGIMTVQIVAGMIALAIGFYLLVEVFVAWLAGRGG